MSTKKALQTLTARQQAVIHKALSCAMEHGIYDDLEDSTAARHLELILRPVRERETLILFQPEYKKGRITFRIRKRWHETPQEVLSRWCDEHDLDKEDWKLLSAVNHTKDGIFSIHYAVSASFKDNEEMEKKRRERNRRGYAKTLLNDYLEAKNKGRTDIAKGVLQKMKSSFTMDELTALIVNGELP